METEISFECVVLIISLAVVISILIDRYYRFKTRDAELKHEKELQAARLQDLKEQREEKKREKQEEQEKAQSSIGH
ncbi:hypothetical protein [Porphyromonas sp. COT-239 OH1446]|uniref:hypothetical protein n=1 Tax=Porphyromonas sp. COT-239 OH1446 TaxID=1515613 RepID=UPI00055ABC13|nr:hypothetical protein [Porphyromonas sp. COT-239 OH1446]